MENKDNDKNLTASSVADLLGVSTRRVQQLTKEKIISGKKIKGRYVYDLFIISKEYIKYLSDKINGKEKTIETSRLEESKLLAEVGIKESKRKMLDMKLNVLEGSLHKAEDVKEMTTDLVLNIRGILLSFPGQLAFDIVKCNTASEASEMLESSVHDVLSELSKYEYDPNAYRKKVMEDEGWLGDSDEDDRE